MTQQTDILLILDALDQVITDPFGRHGWRRLGMLSHKNTNPEILRTIRYRLNKEVDQHGLAGFYRAIFFRHVLGIKSEIINAGKSLEQIRPIHIDRLMSYVNFEWGDIVAENQNSTEFIQKMEEANIPRLMEMAGTVVQQSTPPQTIRVAKTIKRIAIYTPQLFNYKHPPTKMAFEHARLLQLEGIEIRIFSCQEQSILNMREYLSNDGHLKIPPPETNFEHQITFTSPVEIVRAQEQYSLPLRAQSILQLMDLFQPDLCFFIGHQSLLLKSLYQRYPLLGLNVTSVAPCGELDVWLSADIAAKESKPEATSQAYYHPFRTIPKETLATIQREELGLAADAVVLITAGARLHKEITGEWASMMQEICVRFPQVVWLIVGADGGIPIGLQANKIPNIKSIPYQANLKGVYACCDIYVNPPRLGGGFSVAEAMAEGLATLAYHETDGGKKLGALAARNHEDYFSELSALINDPTARESKGKQLKQIFETSINLHNSGPSLLRAISLTHEKFKRRATPVTLS
jgi:glycosyltransferase involved in cell wall biosynthesis